jgi:transposase
MCGEYVGIDFHRRRSVVVRNGPGGTRLSVVRIDNSPAALAEAVTAAGDHPQVVLEATYGWYWAVEVLGELGATVHLANPNALNWGERRVRNDVVDATDLADMLRLGRLPEAWIAPPGYASCVSWCATGPSWCSCAQGSRPRSMR